MSEYTISIELAIGSVTDNTSWNALDADGTGRVQKVSAAQLKTYLKADTNWVFPGDLTVGRLLLTGNTAIATNGWCINPSAANQPALYAGGNFVAVWTASAAAPMNINLNSHADCQLINTHAGASAITRLCWRNSASGANADSGRIDLNGGNFSGGHGASAMVVNNLLASIWFQTNGVDVAQMDFATHGFAYRSLRASKTANYTVLAADAGTQFDNIGAAGEVDFTLPAAAAGLRYGFTCAVNQTLKIIAGASTTIANGATISAAAGNASANAKYAHLELEAVSATEWVANCATGTWTIT
jgi:hypothetical protein